MAITNGNCENFKVLKLTKGKCTKALLKTYDTILNDLYTEPDIEEVFGCFLAIEDNFEKDEVETTAQATEKTKKQKKTPVRSKEIRSMLGTGLRRNFHKFLNWSKSIKLNV